MNYIESPNDGTKAGRPVGSQSFLKQSLPIVGTIGITTIGLVAGSAGATNSDFSIPLEPIPNSPPAEVVTPNLVKPAKVQPAVKLSEPKISVPPRTTSTATILPKTGKNSYLDTTSYQNAPKTSDSPPVIVSDRQSGCQRVVSNGAMSSCGGGRAIAAPATGTAQRQVSTRVARSSAIDPPARYNYVAASHSPAASRSSSPAAAYYPEYSHAIRRRDVVTDGQTALLFPLSIPARISSTFGWRVHPIAGTRRMHYGTDIAAPLGTPVLAAYGGAVAVAEQLGGYGLTVILRHEGGTQESRYAHLSRILVEPGQWIERGSVIGLVGSTGFSTGPHLHFEWRHLTQNGWVATDAGLHLHLALDDLVKSMQTAQNQTNLGG